MPIDLRKCQKSGENNEKSNYGHFSYILADFSSQGASIEFWFPLFTYLDQDTTFDTHIAHICDNFFLATKGPPFEFL